MDATTRVIWTAAGNIVERVRSYRTTTDLSEYQDAREDFEEPVYIYQDKQLNRDPSRDPFLGFPPNWDFGATEGVEEFRIRDLGDFTDRFQSVDAEAEAAAKDEEEEDIPAVVDPQPLLPSHVHAPVQLSEPSALLSADDCRALASALPVRHRWRRWHLLYSSSRDGISLATLLRRAECGLPSILAVRDTQRHVFGCFTAEPWHNSLRYYGNGETFVYQTQPNQHLWRWYQKRMQVSRNDFFQWTRTDRLAVGGAPHYALSLDGDLLTGSSGTCDTFGSTCLAGSEEFEIGRVELWGLS